MENRFNFGLTLAEVQGIIDYMEETIDHAELPEYYDSLVRLRNRLRAGFNATVCR